MQHRTVIRREAKSNTMYPAYWCEQHLEEAKVPELVYYLMFQL